MNSANNIIISLSSDGASIKVVTDELYPEVDITNQKGKKNFVNNYLRTDAMLYFLVDFYKIYTIK